MEDIAICLIKPDGMDYEGEIRSYLISLGITIIKEVSLRMVPEDVVYLYPSLAARPDALALTCKSMTVGPVKMLLCRSEGVFDQLRSAKQYLRATYKKDNAKGVVHTSEHKEEAAREIEYFLKA